MNDFWNNIINNIGEYALEIVLHVIGAILILVIGFKLVKLVMKLTERSKAFENMPPSPKKFFGSFLRTVLKCLVVLAAAAFLGVSGSSIVALIGSAGLAVGLALQGGLANLAGGFIILIFKPFEINDFITVNDISGTVSDIDIFYTTLVTPDNARIVIPNSPVTSQTVKAFNKFKTRRVDLIFSVDYSSDIDKVRSVLLSAADDPVIVTDPKPEVLLDSAGDSALNFILRVWCESGNYLKVNSGIKEKCVRALIDNGINIPFPQLDVHLDK